jgi:hypothetical protein
MSRAPSTLTRAEVRALEASYRALMTRVRALSARLSRASVLEVQTATRAVARDWARLSASKAPLTAAQATAMRARVTAGLAKIERTWLTASVRAKTGIMQGIVDEHRTVHLRTARVLEVGNTKGISLKLSLAPKAAQRSVARALAQGTQSPARLIKLQVARMQTGFTTYLKNATAREASSAEALAGMQRLIKGDLPFNIPGALRSEIRGAASIASKPEQMLITENFALYRELNNESLKGAPVTMIAQWLLADRHDVPDECDDLATDDVGYGEGWYPPEEWPDTPHPWCQCGQGDVQLVTD